MIIILIFADLVAGFLMWLYLRDYISRFSWWKTALIKSVIYSLFFGIGALGEGGGEPGFMLPYPVLPAAIVALVESKWNVLVQNALLPYVFWVVVFFGFYCVRQGVLYLRKTKQANRFRTR